MSLVVGRFMTDTVRRDYLLEQAVRAGKFPATRIPHYVAQYDRDPAGTEQLLASLTPVPTSGVLGHSGDEVDQTLAAGRALLGNRSRVASVPAAAAGEPVQAQHLRPVEQPASAVELTPENVERWTRALFPETRAGAGAGRKRITSDMQYKRGAAA